jgi:ABC-type transporter Mla MlaB component
VRVAGPDEAPFVLIVRGPIGHDVLASWCDEVRARVRADATARVICDVQAAPVDGSTVDALARLQLVARRFGGAIRLRNAGPELQALLDFAGLFDVLPAESALTWQSEEREQVSVDEHADGGDPTR